MAQSITVLCSVLMLLPHCSICATFVEGQTMRRERPATSVHLSAHGELVHQAKAHLSSQDYCDMDFPLGNKDTKGECKDSNPGNGDNSTKAIEESNGGESLMCEKAAELAGATVPDFTYSIGSDDYNKHPKGCFLHSCSQDIVKNCYFYNGAPSQPTAATVSGTPVCFRPKYQNGTQFNSEAPTDTGGCDTPDYAVISTYQDCFDYATCKNSVVCKNQHFKIGDHNASKHLDYPKGCFQHSDGCVYWNDVPAALGDATSVTGRPVCAVVNPTSFWDAKNAAIAAAATPAPAASPAAAASGSPASSS
jgi:hypothetical protein